MKKDSENEADAIRSDIDQTRRKMDDTMDALGDRLQPRHLVDEVLGWFRAEGSSGEPRLNEMRDKVTRATSSAVSGIVDTVKQNPLPALVIGAGIAWLIFESRRKASAPARHYTADYSTSEYSAEIEYDPDVHYDRPLEYPTPESVEPDVGKTAFQPGNGSSSASYGTTEEDFADTGSAGKEGLKGKLSNLGEKAKDKLSNVKQRAADLGGAAKRKAGEAYTATRERVVTTADEHPLEVGLCCLAAGLIAGLALPTPEKVNRIAGPTADRLRQRARQAGSEMVDKGKRVVRAAATAARDEAKAQGFDPERVRDQAGAVARRAGDAAGDAARREGFGAGPQEQGERRGENAGSQSTSSDPSSARPAV